MCCACFFVGCLACFAFVFNAIGNIQFSGRFCFNLRALKQCCAFRYVVLAVTDDRCVWMYFLCFSCVAFCCFFHFDLFCVCFACSDKIQAPQAHEIKTNKYIYIYIYKQREAKQNKTKQVKVCFATQINAQQCKCISIYMCIVEERQANQNLLCTCLLLCKTTQCKTINKTIRLSFALIRLV